MFVNKVISFMEELTSELYGSIKDDGKVSIIRKVTSN